FIRYSGKEMDVSGLYYYGARYYAPWLQRWISPDPAGDVDGLNLYGFVGNNPIIHVDQTGNSKVFSEILNSAEWIGKKAVGAIDKAKTLTDQVHNLATEFDGLIPDDADIGELRKSMTLGKFLMSKHGLSSAAKGAVKGFLAGGTIGTAVPGIGNGIGAGVGAVVGLIAFPLLRYYFLKKGLKLAHTLRTQEIKDGLNTVSNGVEVAKDLINKGAAGANGLTDLAETLKALPSQAKELLDKQLNAFTDEQKLEFYALVEDGTKPLRAIMQVKNTVQTTLDNPSEADGVTGRLQALAATIAEDPRPRPVPKPRTKFNLRKPDAESFA
ncbi:RHS repeat-associated core domain-containing protein, partial [Pseudomonas sp. Irchel 3E19]|uniref:RHS repeat-associated core domain-containing protein n=1 Tax=Pseudomonas sp. Irchel 3E19 TaxID=2008981 RepID=UPI00273B721A